MRLIALVAAALLAGCASDGLIDQRTLGCGPGEALSFEAGIDNATFRETGSSQNFELIVAVSNNSHEDVYVTNIRAEQTRADNAVFRVENAYRKYDQLIEEGDDHTFRLPMTSVRSGTARATGSPDRDHFFELVVTVTLSNGDSYRCPFGFR